jgi:NADH dehydrogenase [ubiquinone] 1 alpha subcomplex assembly factor 1
MHKKDYYNFVSVLMINNISSAAKRLNSAFIVCAMGIGLGANFTMAGHAMASTKATLTSSAQTATAAPASTPAQINTGIEMSEASELQNWVIVNDTVMGGRSRANLRYADDHIQFTGDLSMRNNGGFASIRRIYEAVTWQSKKTIQIVVRGDGRNYQFRLRTNRYMDGVAYVKAFSTRKGEWQTITFSEDDFTAQFRGRLVARAEDLSFSDIMQLGFVLADGQPGGFELHVKAITQIK